jgi:hypothetical protein
MATRDITFDGETFVANPNFQMVLFTDAKDIPDSLVARTVVLDGGKLSLSSVEEVITRCFVDYVDPDLIPRVRNSVHAEAQKQITIVKSESEMLSRIRQISRARQEDPSYEYLTDETTFGSMMQAKECYFATAHISSDFKSVLDEFKVTVEPFAPHISLSKLLWETLSRVMPDVNPCHVFPFSFFVKVLQSSIRSCGSHQGALPANKHPALRDAILHSVIKAVIPMMPFEDSILFMFLSAFSLAKQQGKCKDSDLESVLDHLREEFYGKCDFKSVDMRGSDPLDQLKYSNITNVFTFITRFINEQFDASCLENLPVFVTENFISSSSSIPLLIKTHHQRDPTLLLETYISIRGKSSQYALASLCDDPVFLKRAQQLVAEALPTSHWIILHFETPTPRISSFFFDLLPLLDNPSPEFRLILICSDTFGLPTELLVRCERIDYCVVPSIRWQMLEILQHHSSTISGSANPRSFKKIAYMFSFLFAVLRFRSFIEPLGFTDSVVLEEVSLRNLLIRTKEVIDVLGIEEIPIRNFRDSLLDIEFGSSVINCWDARKLRLHVYALTAPEILDDGFTIVDQQASDSGSYQIPSDSVKVNDWFHVVEKMPAYPCGDVLSMNNRVSQPLRNWSLSRWLARPFLALKPSVAVEEREMRLKLSALLKQFPEKIALKRSDFRSPLKAFLLGEIEMFNTAASLIKMDLSDAFSGNNVEVYRSIERNRTPVSWHEVLGFSGTRNPTKFSKMFKAKRELLHSWMTNGVPPAKIDVSCLRSLRGLLESFLNEIAVQRQASSDVMAYEFVIGGEKAEGSGLTLTGLNLVAGNWGYSERALVQPNAKTLAISQLPDCFCAATKSSTKLPHTYMCPVFRAMPSQQFMLECDRKLIDGEFDNLQWHIPIRTDIVERQLVSTGVCIVCHLPDSF